jgi:diketogulonate reductase-like aldo/keto reductase
LIVATLASDKLIPTVTLNNGVEMPAIAAGTWQYNLTQAKAEVADALSIGLTNIDAAHDYCSDGTTGFCPDGSNSVAIGQAIAEASLKRDEFFITTKIPGCGKQGVGNETCAEDSLAAANKNLDELKLDYVDVLLVHFPDISANCTNIQNQWAALSDLVKQEKVRALGVSNFCKSSIECLISGNATGDVLMPAVNQIQYHVGMGPDPEGIVSYCESKGIQIEAYSPLGDRDVLIKGELVNQIGAPYNKSGVQVALRWIYQHGAVLTTKSSN